ncbi:MAG: class I SAM-dependent methyltransferase [Planctomycetaceae bacterium]
MSKLVKKLDAILYPRFASHWDDETFRAEILKHLSPSAQVLDLGAGAGVVSQMNFRGLAARVCGVDLDPRVVHNAYLDEARIAAGESIPYGDQSFDVVFADNVLEHLAEPEQVFREACRVLKPGGVFLVKTPNKWHYVPLIARFTPHWFHALVNRLRGRASQDTFPTLYRANTPSAVAKIAASSELEVVSVNLTEGRPEYLRLTWPTYLAGWAYERLVNLTPGLDRFRVVMTATFRKPDVVAYPALESTSKPAAAA